MPQPRHRFRRLRLVGHQDPPDPEPLNPSLAAALRTLLTAAGETHLVSAVDELRMVEPCSCGQPECASFYTISPAETRWLWNKGGRTINLGQGLSVDVVDGLIVAVEVMRQGVAT